MLDVKVKDWVQKDRNSGKTLAFGLWNGRVSIQVYDSANMKNKNFRRNLSEDELVLIEKVINKVIAGSPETKLSCQFQEYDRNSKQFRIKAVIAIEKDSKQVYRMSLTDCDTNQTFTFSLKSPATMTSGNEPLNDGNLSSIKIETLKHWFTSARIWAPATIQPLDPNRRAGGGGYKAGGSGYSAPAGGGAPAPSGVESDSDNLPF